MDKEVIYQLLKFLRGPRTQKNMSKFVGAAPNDYHKWESGYKNILVKDFKAILAALGIDLNEVLTASLGINNIGEFKSDTVRNLESFFICDQKSFLQKSGFSDSKWWRLKNESKELTLIDFFKIIHFRSHQLYQVFEQLQFTQYSHVDKKHSSLDKVRLFRNYVTEVPYFAEFTASIYLSSIREEPDERKKVTLIAEKLSVSPSKIAKLIQSLVKDELIEKLEDGNFEFKAFENHLKSDLRLLGINLFEDIFHKTLSVIKSEDISAKFFYRVAPLSEEGRKKIQDLQYKHSKEVYDVILNDPSDKRTEIFSFIMSSYAK
jgi:transcriptional regulator with XRE-family HTH domain